MSAMSPRNATYFKIRFLLLEYINEHISNFEVRKKSQSFVMKVLGSFLFFNKGFMTRYITTIYPKIYVPDWWGRYKKNNYLELGILMHEYVHLMDRKRLGWFFNILYLSPQIFALFALGAFWNLWFLLFLLFLLPWPSPGRTWIEMRGYRMTIAFFYWTKRKKYDINMIVGQFTGENYYYMFPFKKYLKMWFNKEFDKIKNNELSPELVEAKKILERVRNV